MIRVALFGSILLALGIGAGGVATGCAGPSRRAASTVVTREFVGTIQLGKPARDPRRKLIGIPVSFSNGPLAQRDDLMVQRVDASVAGETICFNVVTCPRTGTVSQRPTIWIHGIGPGSYKLFYENPDLSREFIADVVIPSESQSGARKD
ncbi:MAG: hypothetical protein AB7O52_09705 [Planctomycetota bacterium]